MSKYKVGELVYLLINGDRKISTIIDVYVSREFKFIYGTKIISSNNIYWGPEAYRLSKIDCPLTKALYS